MKMSIRIILLIAALFLLLNWSGCAGPANATVGVGVAVPGPWVGGPHPGYGGVWVGRPYPPRPYYPLLDEHRTFVQQLFPESTNPGKLIYVPELVRSGSIPLTGRQNIFSFIEND